MSRASFESCSPIICQEGELYKLTFGEDGGLPDSYRYFSQDVGSQTDDKDVVQILELTNALKILTIDNVELKRNLNLTRSSLQSDFYRRLTNASNNLYSRMNQRLEEVERSQRDRVEVVRRAFRTQLSDALSQMAALYNERMRKKLTQDRTFIESEESVKYTKKIADLTTKMKRYETRIKELEKQITTIEENTIEEQPTMVFDSESEGSEKMIEEDRVSLVESEVNETAMENEIKQKEYMEELVKRIEILEKQNNTYQREINHLESDVEKLNSELVASNGTVDVLRTERKMIQEEMNKLEKHHSQRVLDLEMIIVAEKDKIPTVIEAPIIEKPSCLSVDVQKNFKEFPDMSKEVTNMKKLIKEMTDREGELSNEISQIRSKFVNETKSYLEQIKVLQSMNEKLRLEMFTRQQLQSHFKRLHSASVKYAKSNHPIGILPTKSMEKNYANHNTNLVSIKETSASIPNIIDTSLLSNFVEMNI